MMIVKGTFLFPVLFVVCSANNFYQKMEVGEEYHVTNRASPPPNDPSVSYLWKWTGEAPEGSQIEVACRMDVADDPDCAQEKLLLSLDGKAKLENAISFCGNKYTAPITTQANIVLIGFQSAYYTHKQEGNFDCTVIVKVEYTPCNCGLRAPDLDPDDPLLDPRQAATRIFGGEEPRVDEHPMMAGLYNVDDHDVFAGGTIISDRYVLTVAHALRDVTPSTLSVLVGDHNLISTADDTEYTALYPTIQFIEHQDYYFTPVGNRTVGGNDIAIVKTEKQIVYDYVRVGPACLPLTQMSNSFAGETVIVFGWGCTEFTGPKSDVLLKTELNILGYSECCSRDKGSASKICTYTSGHDSCQGDSGGGLHWRDKSKDRVRINVVGIVSSGVGCGAGTNPGINTRVTTFLNWIVTNTPDASYCVP